LELKQLPYYKQAVDSLKLEDNKFEIKLFIEHVMNGEVRGTSGTAALMVL